MLIKTITTANFREVPADPALLAKAIESEKGTIQLLRNALKEEYVELDEANLGRALQRISEYLRLAGAYDEALRAKDAELEIWQRLGREKALFLAHLRRAVILHYASRHEEAIDIMERLEARLDQDTRVYEDTLLEAKARCLWESRRFDEAHHALSKALRIREARGNARHIEQTKHLLANMSPVGALT